MEDPMTRAENCSHHQLPWIPHRWNARWALCKRIVHRKV